jgi:hypothetical protein
VPWCNGVECEVRVVGMSIHLCKYMLQRVWQTADALESSISTCRWDGSTRLLLQSLKRSARQCLQSITSRRRNLQHCVLVLKPQCLPHRRILAVKLMSNDVIQHRLAGSPVLQCMHGQLGGCSKRPVSSVRVARGCKYMHMHALHVFIALQRCARNLV